MINLAKKVREATEESKRLKLKQRCARVEVDKTHKVIVANIQAQLCVL